MKSSKISNLITESLKNDDLSKIAIDFSEVAVDSFFDDGLIKDIPILSSFIGCIKTVRNVRDILFTKKLIHFLSELSDIPAEKRCEIIEKIDNSEKYKVKIGEKLTYIIDRCDDHYKAKIVALFFVSFLQSEITYDEFLKLANIIDRMYINDFIDFAKSTKDDYSFNDKVNYAGSGLVEIYFEPVMVRDNDDWKSGNAYETEGGGSLFITPLGVIARRVLSKKII